MDVQKGYDQTQAVYRLRSVIKEERRLWIYTDYVILHMADLLRGSNSLSDFCHPYILQIFRYDQENDTSYLETLREYLTNINKSMTGQDLLIDNGEQLKSNFIW